MTSALLRPFFGGAITCHVPSDWRDVSDIRQVPDHQECWQSPAGQVFVVEILQRHDDVTDDQAASFFFHDLAQANGVATTQQDGEEGTQFTAAATAPPVGSMNNTFLPKDAIVRGGVGRQLAAKGPGDPRQRRLEKEWVRVDLCVIRLPHVTTDILITLTSPQTTPLAEFVMGFDLVFLQMLESFCIVDWTLFG